MEFSSVFFYALESILIYGLYIELLQNYGIQWQSERSSWTFVSPVFKNGSCTAPFI
jgi:hypothetical protein